MVVCMYCRKRSWPLALKCVIVTPQSHDDRRHTMLRCVYMHLPILVHHAQSQQDSTHLTLTSPKTYTRLVINSTMNHSSSSSTQQKQPVREVNAAGSNDVKTEGEKIAQWFDQLFEKSTTFASILAAVMFSAMILDFDNPRIPHGSHQEVRTWAATGAILFVLLVLLCTGCSLGLKFHGKAIGEKYELKVFWVRYGFQVVSFLFQGLLLAGTLFFCLVVKAYAPGVGWTAFGITSVCLLVSFGLWLWQLKLEICPQCGKAKGQSGSGGQQHCDGNSAC